MQAHRAADCPSASQSWTTSWAIATARCLPFRRLPGSRSRQVLVFAFPPNPWLCCEIAHRCATPLRPVFCIRHSVREPGPNFFIRADLRLLIRDRLAPAILPLPGTRATRCWKSDRHLTEKAIHLARRLPTDVSTELDAASIVSAATFVFVAAQVTWFALRPRFTNGYRQQVYLETFMLRRQID